MSAGSGGWVPVNDRLPSESGYVLVACDGGNVCSTFFCTDPSYFDRIHGNKLSRKTHGKWSKHFEIARRYGYRITHWQPRPPAPPPVEASQQQDWPECSGDPMSCPENEGYGCCKPNRPASQQQASGEKADEHVQQLMLGMRTERIALAAELCRITAEVEALRKDAERYRFVRSCDYEQDHKLHNAQYSELLLGERLDAAIDAAREVKL